MHVLSDDFSRPKIVWGEISDRSKFTLDCYGEYMPEATTFLMVGEHLAYLLCILNSPLSEWFFSKVGTTTGVGTVRWKKYTIQELLIPKISEQDVDFFARLVDEAIKGSQDLATVAKLANMRIYEIVELTNEEVSFVENYHPQLF